MTSGDPLDGSAERPAPVRRRWPTALALAVLAVFVSLVGVFVLPALRAGAPARLPDPVLSIDKQTGGAGGDCPNHRRPPPRA
jgi:hypothetical protein